MKKLSATGLAPVVLLLIFPVSGCRSKSPREEAHQPAASVSAPEPSDAAVSGYEQFHRKHPNATVLHPIDTHTLTESQIKFGIAPRRDPSVEYQPDIILMEQGDRAIKSVAGDGLTWTFDANAPQVSDFAIDKVVFATGRAVGRVIALKREGDSVQVVLGPVELTDLIRNGTFEMDAAVDLSNAISYVAPDYPEPSDEDQKNISLNERAPIPSTGNQVVSARRPLQESMGGAHLLRLSANRGINGPRLLRVAQQGVQVTAPGTNISDLGQNTPKPPNLNKQKKDLKNKLKNEIPKPPTTIGQGLGTANKVLNATPPDAKSVPDPADVPYGPTLHLPGLAGVEGISPLKIAEEAFNPPKMLGQVPVVELAGGTAIPINGSDTSVGMEYKYDQDGLHVLASGKLILGESHLRFFLHINNGGVEDCGIRLAGNMSVHLRLNARALQNFSKDFHKTLYLPIDISVPLGGAVPLSLTFTSSFVLHSAFSARGSVLNAKGDYSFGAGMDAGYWSKAWRFNAGADAKGDTEVADTVEGISVGWNSAILGFGERALVGVGAFGLKAGVFVAVRFTGSAVKGPNITFPCRQGSMDISLETGVGYSLAEWLKNAINFFLRPITDKTVDRAGTFVRGPVKSLYHKVKQIPDNCTQRGSG